MIQDPYYCHVSVICEERTCAHVYLKNKYVVRGNDRFRKGDTGWGSCEKILAMPAPLVTCEVEFGKSSFVQNS